MTAWNQIVELAVWGMDQQPDRERYCDHNTMFQIRENAERRVRCGPVWESTSPIVPEATRDLAESHASHAQRADFQREFGGLKRQMQIVDLRRLISFQRRLVFRAEKSNRSGPAQLSWRERADFAFPAERKSDHSADLLSDRPPAVVGFCEDNLIFQWRRPALPKLIRIAAGESYETIPGNFRKEHDDEHCNDAR